MNKTKQEEGLRVGREANYFCFTITLEDYSWGNTNIMASNLLKLGASAINPASGSALD